MNEQSLPLRLDRDDEDAAIAAFPDGSVDTFYGVSVGGERVTTRATFADVIEAEHATVFTLHRESVEPGGHAVNLAVQANCLGNDVTLAGHLDDPAFTDLPFETVSMGDPAEVSVYGFDDGDLLTVENSAALDSWTLDDLEGALGDGFTDFLTADAVCCVNWTSIESVPSALSAVADADVDGDWFVVDPGSLAGRSKADFGRFFDALEALAAAYDVVLTGNPREIGRMATVFDQSVAGGDAEIETLRERAGVSGVVVHGESRAAVATSDGIVAEENFDVDVSRRTGGGDRFDAGLVHALVRDWGWRDALRLGNACASRYVASGESGTSDDLADFLRDHG